jgi:4-carboxymuconolactone decarboxylase
VRSTVVGDGVPGQLQRGIMPADEEMLRRIAINDPHCLEDILSGDDRALSALDPTVTALIRVAGLISVDAPQASLSWSVSEALERGATPSDVIGALLAIAPAIGTARVVASAPRLALALGWDIDAALETLDQPAAAQ